MMHEKEGGFIPPLLLLVQWQEGKEDEEVDEENENEKERQRMSGSRFPLWIIFIWCRLVPLPDSLGVEQDQDVNGGH